MTIVRSLAALVALAVVTAACSAAGSGPAVPLSHEVNLVGGALTIKIPLHVRGVKRGDFVSPSTRSATLSVAPGAGCSGCTPAFTQDVSLLPSSKACVQSVAGTTCTIGLALAAGKYVAALSTYDGPPRCQSAAVACRALSTDQSFAIVASAGGVKAPSVVLSGIPHGLVFTLLDWASLTSPNPSYLNLRAVGPGAKGRVLLSPVDADGNVILGPGAPSFKVTAGGGFSSAVAGTIVQFTAPAKLERGSFPITIAARGPGCASAGAVCSFKGTIAFDGLVAVTQFAGNAVAVYPGHLLLGQRYALLSQGVNKPVADVFDPSGNLYVLNAGNATLTEYAPPYAGSPMRSLSAGLNKPFALAMASDGDVAVANRGNGSVVVFTPPGVGLTWTIALPAAPSAVAFDAKKNLWIALPGEVRRYAPPYNTAPDLVLNGANGISSPVALAFDYQGTLYVGDTGYGGVMDFPKPYAGPPANQQPYAGTIHSLTIGGEVVAVCGKGNIELRDTGSLQVGVSIPISDGAVQFCTLDQDLTLYETDSLYHQISEFDWQGYAYRGYLTDQTDSPSALAAYP